MAQSTTLSIDHVNEHYVPLERHNSMMAALRKSIEVDYIKKTEHKVLLDGVREQRDDMSSRLTAADHRIEATEVIRDGLEHCLRELEFQLLVDEHFRGHVNPALLDRHGDVSPPLACMLRDHFAYDDEHQTWAAVTYHKGETQYRLAKKQGSSSRPYMDMAEYASEWLADSRNATFLMKPTKTEIMLTLDCGCEWELQLELYVDALWNHNLIHKVKCATCSLSPKERETALNAYHKVGAMSDENRGILKMTVNNLADLKREFWGVAKNADHGTEKPLTDSFVAKGFLMLYYTLQLMRMQNEEFNTRDI